MALKSLTNALLLALASAAAAEAQSVHPRITLDYLPMFDAACVEATKQPIEPGAVEELQRELETLRAFWEREQPTLLGAVVSVTGVPFTFSEARAALFLCRGFPSMSLPLMINARGYVPAAANGPVTPLIDFSNVILHEALHRYVGDRLADLPGRSTALLQKYRDEPQAVRNHLHLYAIEQLVYDKLGRREDLDRIKTYERKFPKAWAVAQRARAIIATERAESFVREFGPARP